MNTNGGRYSNTFHFVLRSSQNQNATTEMSTDMTPIGDETMLVSIIFPLVGFQLR